MTSRYSSARRRESYGYTGLIPAGDGLRVCPLAYRPVCRCRQQPIAFRYGLLGVSDIPLWTAFLIILGFIAVLFAFGMYLLQRGVGIKS